MFSDLEGLQMETRHRQSQGRSASALNPPSQPQATTGADYQSTDSISAAKDTHLNPQVSLCSQPSGSFRSKATSDVKALM